MSHGADGPRSAGQRLTAWVAAVALVLSGVGCQTSGSAPGGSGGTGQAAPARTAPVSAAERQMLEDQDRFNKTVIGGAVTWALGMAATCALVLWASGSKDRTGKVAMCALIGAAVGAADAWVVAKKWEAGNNELRATQAAAADVRNDNQKLQTYLASSGKVLDEGKSRLAALRSDVAAKRISAEQAEQARQREEQNIASMKAGLEHAKKTRADYQQASAKFQSAPQAKRDLDGEIARMDTQVAQLERNIADYNRALAVSRA